MKVGDLVIRKSAKPGESIPRLILKFGKKETNLPCNEITYQRSVVYFINGGWDWKDQWRLMELFDSRLE